MRASMVRARLFRPHGEDEAQLLLAFSAIDPLLTARYGTGQARGEVVMHRNLEPTPCPGTALSCVTALYCCSAVHPA